MTTEVLSGNKQREWSERLNEGGVGAKALVFERAQSANASLQVEVTNGQSPEGKTLIIHLTKRPDIVEAKAIEIAQHALVDVFGTLVSAEAECDYRNVEKLKEKMGNEMVGTETHDNLTVIFNAGKIARTRRPSWVRDQMALAIAKWDEKSRGW